MHKSVGKLFLQIAMICDQLDQIGKEMLVVDGGKVSFNIGRERYAPRVGRQEKSPISVHDKKSEPARLSYSEQALHISSPSQVAINLVDPLTQQLRSYLDWNKSHLDVLSTLVIGLIKKRTVNLTQLATTFPGTSKTLSCYRRIQRFFADMTFEETFVAQLIASLFSPENAWMLSMDRTNPMLGKFKINILYLAINHKGMAIPLFWTLLPKKGCSNTKERIELLEKFRKAFKVKSHGRKAQSIFREGLDHPPADF